jgi:DNA mismatch repair protein MutS2
VNERTFRLLDYGEILARLARCALSDEAAAQIREERPLCTPGEVETLKGRVAVILALMKGGTEEQRERLPALAGIFPKLAVEEASLELEDAYALGVFVERGERFMSWLRTAPSTGAGPSLGELVSVLPDCSALGTAIFSVIDREGKLRDLPEFRAIKRRIQALQGELETVVARYTGNEETRRMLQSPLPSQRDGRLVLAVKANFRGRIRGIVHEVSATGQTVFVEPGEVVERNNDILIEQRALDAEIRRVLRDLTGTIAARREELARFHRGIVDLELLRATARYALETGGTFALSDAAGPDGGGGSGMATAGEVPAGGLAGTVGPAGPAGDKAAALPRIALREARHPLLGKTAVPIDLVMARGIRTVIVTGPNTGGKTVVLKTLGLLALMNQSGLALPAAEGSCLPVFDGIYADIGDEQSLSQSLSTFSGHMVNIAGIIAGAGRNSLALLDELGSGTDPEEGSAIAMAILDELIEKGTRLVVTTHHGILKNYGYTRPGVENASMEFDPSTLSPTFRILMGVPGESRALDIAGRNGLPAPLVGQARSYLAEERADVSALIRGLRDRHRELESVRDQARAEERRLREERRKADLRELRLRQKEEELKAGALGQLRALLTESRKTLENLVRELREGEITREKTLGVKEFLTGLETAVRDWDHKLEEERADIARAGQTMAGESGEVPAAGHGAPALGPGVEVLAGPQKRRGRILRPDRKGPQGAAWWIVEIGSLKLSMDEKELFPLAPAAAPPVSYSVSVDLAAPAAARPELSLRGMRLEEALEALRRHIDAAVLGGLHEFAVIHGKGEGVLQKGVHDYLRGESAVADYYFSRPELGGFGRTEVILKSAIPE